MMPQELTVKDREYLSQLRERSYALHKPSRVPHVKGCEETAVELAEIYGCDVKNAATAAILHDVTKKLDNNEQLKLCRRYGIICDENVLSNPQLFHAITGAYYARENFGVSDEVFRAILYHTTGIPGMTLLEKIIYLADCIEPTRNYPGVDELRILARTDIDAALSKSLTGSLENLARRGIVPHKNTVEADAYYKEKHP